MVYGILKLLNFAHGDVYMIGAFIALGVLNLLGGAFNPAIPAGAGGALIVLCMFVGRDAGSGFLGVAIERFAYRPLRDAPRIAPLISALGVAFFLENSMLLLFGSKFRTYNGFDLVSYNGIHFGGDNGVFVQYLGLLVDRQRGRADDRAHRARPLDAARQGDARGLVRPRGGGDDGHRHRPRDRRHVLHRLRPRRRRRA